MISKAPWATDVTKSLVIWALFLSLMNFGLIIYAWNTSSMADQNPDTLSISITVLEIFLVIIAFAGFWMIRGAAVNAATEAARDCSPECTDKWLRDNIEDRIREVLTTNDGRFMLERAVKEIQDRESITSERDGGM